MNFIWRDCEWEEGERAKSTKAFPSPKKERTELTNLVMNRKIEWGVIFDLFQRKGVSVDDLLMGPDFFQIVRECYKRQYANIVFRISCGRCDRSICRFSGH